MPADLSKSILRVEAASRKLKERSERLNQLIASAEEHLQEIDPGLEVWLDDPQHLLAPYPVESSLSEILARYAGCNGNAPSVRDRFLQGDQIVYRVGHRLGWARIGRDFRIAIQVVRENFLENPGELDELVPLYDTEVGRESDVERLQSAARHVRLAALAKLPALLDVISEKLEGYGAAMEKAFAEIEEGDLFRTKAATGKVSQRKQKEEADNDIPF